MHVDIPGAENEIGSKWDKEESPTESLDKVCQAPDILSPLLAFEREVVYAHNFL